MIEHMGNNSFIIIKDLNKIINDNTESVVHLDKDIILSIKQLVFLLLKKKSK